MYAPDAAPVSSIGEERRRGIGQFAAIWDAKHTSIRSRGPENSIEADEPVPPYFALDLFALACGDALFLIVEIHGTNFFRVAPILSKV